MNLTKKLYKRAAARQKTIVFPEAGFSDRTLQAIKIIQKKKIAKVILVGDESALVLRDKQLLNFTILNPKTFQHTDRLAKALYTKRKDKGMTPESAAQLVLDPYYFSTMLVELGYADGMVGGAEVPTAKVLRPALQIIKAKKRGASISSCFFLYGENGFLRGKTILTADAGVLPCPSAEQLVQIAQDSVQTFRRLQLGEPRVAFLSYSTKGSAEGESIAKMRSAYAKFRNTGIPCDGELQFDAAMVPRVAAHKCPQSPIAGDANILIFPDLDAGNICYKSMQYLGGLRAIGPILQGLRKPINDLSRGCTVEEIVTVAAVTVLQCEKEEV